MGLSDEERYRKFYFSMIRLRRKLERLDKVLTQGDRLYRRDREGTVKGLVETVDEIVGELVQRTDSNSLYWVVGPNSDGYQSLFDSYCGLANIGDERRRLEPKQGTIRDVIDDLSMPEVARILCGGLGEEERVILEGIGLWWDAWQEMAATLYPMNRYNDDAFGKKVKHLVTTLIGKMANTRYGVLKDEIYVYTTDDFNHIVEMEQAFLCKYRVLHHMLSTEQNKMDRDTRCDEEYDQQPIVDKVCEMSMADVEEYLKKAYEEEVKSRAEASDREYESKPPKRENLFGPKPRTYAELERILNESNDYDECKKAYAEREHVYNTSGGGWELRFQKGKRAAKRKGRK